VPLVDVEQVLSSKLNDDPLFNADKLERQLQLAILKLPEKQRIVFNMRYYDEVPYEDMSVILGTSVGALKASYHHAYKKIEKYLTGG
jgi:RNA polymerase sigma-70 factor (ECF subfamily)